MKITSSRSNRSGCIAVWSSWHYHCYQSHGKWYFVSCHHHNKKSPLVDNTHFNRRIPRNSIRNVSDIFLNDEHFYLKKINNIEQILMQLLATYHQNVWKYQPDIYAPAWNRLKGTQVPYNNMRKWHHVCYLNTNFISISLDPQRSQE